VATARYWSICIAWYGPRLPAVLFGQASLLLVGVDFNIGCHDGYEAEICVPRGSRRILVIGGDINRSGQLASDLEALDNVVQPASCPLVSRSQSPYSPPANYVKEPGPDFQWRVCSPWGRRLPSDELEENLVRHLRRWAPYVGRFGLLIFLELSYFAAGTYCCPIWIGRPRWHMNGRTVLGPVLVETACILEMRS